MSDCVFCKIAKGEISCTKVAESEHFISFYDIEPQASIHVLVIPKQHIESLNEILSFDSELAGLYLREISAVAKKMGLAETGYRTVFNTNKYACQTVFHIHAHLLGGEPLSGSMG